MTRPRLLPTVIVTRPRCGRRTIVFDAAAVTIAFTCVSFDATLRSTATVNGVAATAMTARATTPRRLLSAAVRSYLRSLDPHLPRDVYTLQFGGLLNAFGNGVVIPFMIIYLHNVRGISLGVAGLAGTTESAAPLWRGV